MDAILNTKVYIPVDWLTDGTDWASQLTEAPSITSNTAITISGATSDWKCVASDTEATSNDDIRQNNAATSNPCSDKQHQLITRAHSFPQRILSNSAGQLAKFRGSPRKNCPNSSARQGLLSMTENCSETPVIEGWHYTKG